MSDQQAVAQERARTKAALREIVGEWGIYWTLTTLAEVVREDPYRPKDLAERVARNIEKARDAA